MSSTVVVVVTAPLAGPLDDAPLIKAEGRESLLRAVELFVNRDGVSRVLLVVPPSRAEEYKRKVGGHLSFMGVRIVTGGETFVEQLAAARPQVEAGTTHVLVHDAARPAVPYTDLDALTAAAARHPVVALAVPTTGPLLRVGSVPGPAQWSTDRVAQIVTPVAFTLAAIDEVVATGGLPSSLQWIEASPLNVRCGQASPGMVKAMIGLLPKPKVKAPSSPFEEAQW
jgi:2-C-methyl-D-erythritol 4-phosphate cytidylyltransferase